jgi:hypothetical protein
VSSNTFLIELKPESLLRRIVILYGIGATALGTALIWMLAIEATWRCAAAVVWLVLNGRQLCQIASGHQHCRCIRMGPSGAVQLQGPDGCWFAATLLPGSVVTGRLAWLRFEAEDGRRFAELLRQKCFGNKDWRRLRVIWNHLGAGG